MSADGARQGAAAAAGRLGCSIPTIRHRALVVATSARRVGAALATLAEPTARAAVVIVATARSVAATVARLRGAARTAVALHEGARAPPATTAGRAVVARPDRRAGAAVGVARQSGAARTRRALLGGRRRGGARQALARRESSDARGRGAPRNRERRARARGARAAARRDDRTRRAADAKGVDLVVLLRLPRTVARTCTSRGARGARGARHVVTVVSEAEARGGPLGELRQALGVTIDEVDMTRVGLPAAAAAAASAWRAGRRRQNSLGRRATGEGRPPTAPTLVPPPPRARPAAASGAGRGAGAPWLRAAARRAGTGDTKNTDFGGADGCAQWVPAGRRDRNTPPVSPLPGPGEGR